MGSRKIRTFSPVKTLLFSAFSMMLVFGTIEIGVRTWVFFFRDPAERFDITTGTFVLVPGVHPRLGAPAIQVNSRGFVGPEFEEPRGAGVTRIVTMGDSCTFRPGTAAEPYPARLSFRLNAGYSQDRYQVINAGIDGLNTELALRRLVSKVIALEPDIITVYLGWNDLMKLDPAGQIEGSELAVVARAMDRSWSIRGMRKLLFHHLRGYISAPATGPGSRTGAFGNYRPTVFENNLRSVVSAARDAGSKVIVMTLPSVLTDDMTVDDLRRSGVAFPYYSSAYAVGDYVDLIAAYNRSIRLVAAAERIPLADLAAEIDRRADRRRIFIDVMHLSEPGRELVADILARRLKESGLL